MIPTELQRELNPNQLLNQVRYGEKPIESIQKILDAGLRVFTIPTYSTIVSLDIDDSKGAVLKGYETIPKVLATIKDSFKTKSRNGNTHVYLRLEDALSCETRSVIAIVLGSDPMREMLSINHVNKGHDFAYVMFETVEEAERLRKWSGFKDNINEITVESLRKKGDLPF